MMTTRKQPCLHLDGPLIIDALNIYETCLTFSQDLRLSTFVFEDFVNALLTPENSRLLCEIHLSLLRFVLQDEETRGTTFGDQDTTNFFYTLIQLLDELTYGEVLRFYAESDLDDRLNASHIVRILNRNYPFVKGTDRLMVLSWLCNQFARTAKYKNICASTRKTSMKPFRCEICLKGGEMVVCDICDGCFHLRCVKLQSLPEGEWFCSSCCLRAKQFGFDCQEFAAANPKLDGNIKQLGNDEDGRFFWLMNDWILAYDPLTKILYLHGSLSQVHNLLRELDADFMEYELSVKIGECLDHLFEQLDLLLCNSVAVDDEETLNETTAQLLDQIVKVLGSEQSRLMHTLWSAKLRSIELICLCNDTNGRWLVMDRDCVFEIFRFYLPANYNFRKYENKLMVEKSMERKGKKQNRGLSLSCTNKFQWLGYDQAFGQESDFGRVIQLTLEKLVEDIPYALKYRHWDEYQEHFLWILSNTTNLDGLKHLLLSAERIIRQPVFAPHWWNSFGALRLYRKAKDDDQSKSPIVSPSNEYAEIFYVRYRQHFPHVLPISRSFDESFRVCNREKMGGWLWKSSTYVTRYEKPPTVKLSDLNYSTPLAPNLPTGIRKVLNLEGSIKVLILWRKQNEAHFLFQQPICYSVECQLKPYEFIQTDRTLFFKCYNSQCPRRNYETNSNKWYCAWRNGKRPRAQSILPTRFIRSTVVGEGIAFPLPRPFEFKSRSTGRKSLFVLPQQALKRLARQGGLKSSFVLPGFKQTNQPVDSQLWPYPCSRPQYDHCWRYRTLKTQSLHSLALSLRILHASIRWNEFNPADPKMKWIHSVLNGHFQIVRFPKSHKELQPDGYSEMYKVELQTWQLTSPDGSRRQVTRILKEKQTVWIDGVDLKPFEIRRYWERYKMLEEKENEPVSKSTKRVFTSSTPEDDTPPKRSRK